MNWCECRLHTEAWRRLEKTPPPASQRGDQILPRSCGEQDCWVAMVMLTWRGGGAGLAFYHQEETRLAPFIES